MLFHNSSNAERLSVVYRDVNELRNVSPSSRKTKLLVFGFAVLCVGALVAVAIVFLPRLFEQQSDSSADKTTTMTTTSTLSSIVSSRSSTLSSTSTSSSTTTTTTTQCPTGYLSSPTGICVDLMTDRNNCGSFGFICSMNYTNCTSGLCSGFVLPPVFTNITAFIWDGQRAVDDNIASVQLPINVTLYNYSSDTILVTSNGVVCLSHCSSAYSNTDLPARNFLGPTAFVFWDDLMIRVRTNQMVFYHVDGFAPNRTTTIEFRVTKSQESLSFFHFQIQFVENSPGLVRFVYLNVTNSGNSSTIGVQSSPSGSFVKYSFNQAIVSTNNSILTFDTNRNTFIG